MLFRLTLYNEATMIDPNRKYPGFEPLIMSVMMLESVITIHDCAATRPLTSKWIDVMLDQLIVPMCPLLREYLWLPSRFFSCTSALCLR